MCSILRGCWLTVAEEASAAVVWHQERVGGRCSHYWNPSRKTGAGSASGSPSPQRDGQAP